MFEQPSSSSLGIKSEPDIKTEDDFIGQSMAAAGVRRLVRKVAPSEATVLILGESGTGKEIIARRLHAQSGRCNGPFVPVNCGAIPADLLESELFGHEKGAFTGALSARRGRFELAAGGTLFLDEIGDMPLSMQVKLLRVLQERCFERVGSAVSLQSDVRIVAATHQDLETRAERGEFRSDLFYRLNVFPIEISPLRQRTDDIPGLLEHFNSLLACSGLDRFDIDGEALRALQSYTWPGNVRELANLVERLAILHGGGRVGLQQLPARLVESLDLKDSPDTGVHLSPVTSGGAVTDLKAHLAEVERTLLLNALNDSDWVVARAASQLRLRRTTFVEKMRKFSIERQK